MKTMVSEREKNLIKYYDSKLTYYSPSNARELFRTLELVDAPAFGKMLDVGCGDGRAAAYAEKHNMDYLGIDYSIERISKARKLHPNANFHAGDIYKVLPQLDAGFSLIWCCEVLEHLEYPELIWGHMKNLCVGKVVCTVPVNMPHKAHLQVFKTEDDLHAKFQGITDVTIISCVTMEGTQRRHFVFTYEV